MNNFDTVEPRWLVILREHRYDLYGIADLDTRRYVANALRANQIELLRGDRGTYQVNPRA